MRPKYALQIFLGITLLEIIILGKPPNKIIGWISLVTLILVFVSFVSVSYKNSDLEDSNV